MHFNLKSKTRGDSIYIVTDGREEGKREMERERSDIMKKDDCSMCISSWIVHTYKNRVSGGKCKMKNSVP